MSERFCRTKQLLDEAGSRVHITIKFQKKSDLERQLEDIRELKCRCQKQKYEELPSFAMMSIEKNWLWLKNNGKKMRKQPNRSYRRQCCRCSIMMTGIP
jgi:hypothetical protein